MMLCTGGARRMARRPGVAYLSPRPLAGPSAAAAACVHPGNQAMLLGQRSSAAIRCHSGNGSHSSNGSRNSNSNRSSRHRKAVPAARPRPRRRPARAASTAPIPPSPRLTPRHARPSCPQGLPPIRPDTFFGQPIPSQSSAKLCAKLLDAQARAMKAMCLGARGPTACQLDGAITTYASHSPSEDRAVDIDVQGQPYIAHEHSSDQDKEAGERAIDAETAPVFQRIAYWSLYRKSVIPKGITSVAGQQRRDPTSRTWTDPAIGVANTPTMTGELYDKLKQESDGMQGYFALLNETDKELSHEIFAFNAVNTDGSVDLAKLEIPSDESDASVQAFRKRIATDYLVLGGSMAQLKDFAGDANAALAQPPRSQPGDRPFQGGALAGATDKIGQPLAAANRRPELGFISLPREVVVALTEVGLVWGAVDFGGGSGDVMHFDCRNVNGC
jgi:hypothetical protein